MLHRFILFWLLLTATGCTSTSSPEAAADELQPAAVALAGGETAQVLETPASEPALRVVWTRDLGDGTDIFSRGDDLVLMGFDSRDGRGEHVILSEPASYAKPLITPSGDELVFSMRKEGTVHTTRWDGSGRRRVADGFALAVWAEPETGEEWVYVGIDLQPTDVPSYRAVRRYRIADPGAGELVWDAQPVSDDSFQLSADGRYAAALFPWPYAGVADLAAGTWEQLGRGCWTAIANDESHVVWYFDAPHRNLTMVDIDTSQQWTVSINGAPGIDSFEVYHPRWTNHPRFLTLTGPYTVGNRDNKIWGGGRQVEVYVGTFNADLTAVEQWTQITRNDLPDFYPDAWVEPGSWSDDGAGRRSVAPRVADAPRVAASARLVVDARVKRATPVPTPRSIAPYKHGLLAMDYEIVELIEGTYEHPTLVATHWVIRDGATIDGAERSLDETYRLTLELYDDHPELEGQRLVLDTREFSLPLYYDIESE